MNQTPTPDKKTKSLRGVFELVDWAQTILIALVSVILIFTFFFRIVVVSGDSMNDTLTDNDYLIISKLGYQPKNGDIVVVQANAFGEKKPLIKRVIATSGQWIYIDFTTWEVFVGDTEDTMEKIDEPYIRREEGKFMDYPQMQYDYPMQVEEGHIFVMGDNRNNSYDSRELGPIDENYVIGHAILRLFPAFGALD